MTTNEKLFQILDRMFPGEYYMRAGYDLTQPFIVTKSLPRVYRNPQGYLESAFWIANEVELFSDFTIHKSLDRWVVVRIVDLICKDHYETYFGGTPQEAIVNAIIAIYGDKEW